MMSIELLIYVADIANGISCFLCVVGFVIGIFSVISFGNASDENEKTWAKWSVAAFAFAGILVIAGLLLPSKQGI